MPAKPSVLELRTTGASVAQSAAGVGRCTQDLANVFAQGPVTLPDIFGTARYQY